MKKQKVLQSLLIPFVILLLFSIIAVIMLHSQAVKSFYRTHAQSYLYERATLVNEIVTLYAEQERFDELDFLVKRIGKELVTRITVVLPSGKVIADSDYNPLIMDNQRDRPEIQDALQGASNKNDRDTSPTKTVFFSTTMPVIFNGEIKAVVRTSLPLKSFDLYEKILGGRLILIGVAVALVAGLLSFILVQRITTTFDELQRGAQRFASGDLHFRLPVLRSSEMNMLAESLNEMAAQLDDRIHTIINQRNQLDAILSSMIEGVIAVDNDERLISLNRAAGKQLKIDTELAQGKSIQELIRNPHLQQLIQQVLLSNTTVEETIVVLNGEERYLQVHGALLRDSKGKTIGAVMVFHDITQIRRLENIRREFVANVSHELKTPVTSIKGFVETLIDGAIDNPDMALRFLNKIRTHGDRLNAIIDDLLKLAKLEQEDDTDEIEYKPASLIETIQTAISLCDHKAQEKNIAIIFEQQDSTMVPANTPLIEQAVVNLIENAVKYSDKNKKIIINLFKKDNHVVVSVQDQGFGIAAEHLPRLFERFYRVDKSHSSKLGGTGLGLAIVKHIAQSHGGFVSVDSIVNKGSTFSIHLPCNR